MSLRRPCCWLLLPLAAYAASYAVLAIYHGSPWIWGTVVHESGRLTLYQDFFYSAHFLGHVPVQAVLALAFAGAYLGLGGRPAGRSGAWAAGGALAVFLALALAHSVWEFGWGDTWGYIAQNMQGAGLRGDGGSWKLHLASTLSLPLALPAYAAVAARLSGRRPQLQACGWGRFAAALALIPAVTWLAEGAAWEPIAQACTSPRYLAHAVREVATFPVTYFPLAIFLLEKGRAGATTEASAAGGWPDRGTLWAAAVPLLFFLACLSYQMAVPLSVGIGELAQKPAFAEGGKLGIAYLLASHYPEHLLDTVAFALFCRIFAAGSGRRG